MVGVECTGAGRAMSTFHTDEWNPVIKMDQMSKKNNQQSHAQCSVCFLSDSMEMLPPTEFKKLVEYSSEKFF